MQMTENIVEAFKSVYVMIIFLSLFLLSTNIDAECYQDSDCPEDMCSYLAKPTCIFTEYFPIFWMAVCGCD
ncbi:putative Late nodulin [Medicago truncatula]|uniref:Putative Late nodulin n=1 Tax=Medicago truncatula TaxID=3880 RepID=A0A396I8R6_MEDTR|nr:putative Late nodulin [Medicago truncatula]